MVTAATAAVSAETAWDRGRFDARAGKGQVLFGRMYEDTTIELGVFPPGGRVLCIASAGDTAMALAASHDVVAVDINPVQLAYAERRFAGAERTVGTAERVMASGRVFLPLLGWRRTRVLEFLALDDPAQQAEYWRLHLDTARFRVALDAMFSFSALRTVYASPFLNFLPARLGAVMRGRLQRGFALHANRSNPFARALLTGELDHARPDFDPQRIRLVHSDAAAYLEAQPAGSFNGFTLSNILDGAAPSYRERLRRAVRHAAASDAVVVHRSFGEPPATLTGNRAADDRALLWGIVDVRRASDSDDLVDGAS
jgi:S-adenosylmethionine:diacylglycerol 3-amino-3-carboxypropyl transferase